MVMTLKKLRGRLTIQIRRVFGLPIAQAAALARFCVSDGGALGGLDHLVHLPADHPLAGLLDVSAADSRGFRKVIALNGRLVPADLAWPGRKS